MGCAAKLAKWTISQGAKWALGARLSTHTSNFVLEDRHINGDENLQQPLQIMLQYSTFNHLRVHVSGKADFLAFLTWSQWY